MIASCRSIGWTHESRWHIIDTHNGNVIDPVWDLYREAIELSGAVSTLTEWDDDIPELPVLLSAASKAKQVRAAALASRSTRLEGAPVDHARGLRGPPQVQLADASVHRAWSQGGPRESVSSEGETP